MLLAQGKAGDCDVVQISRILIVVVPSGAMGAVLSLFISHRSLTLAAYV